MNWETKLDLACALSIIALIIVVITSCYLVGCIIMQHDICEYIRVIGLGMIIGGSIEIAALIIWAVADYDYFHS